MSVKKPAFVHLNVHTEYSIQDGLIRINEWLDRVASSAMPAVAVVDKMNLFAAVKFYTQAIKRGIKPIVGAELQVRTPSGEIISPIALCQSEKGYRNLNSLISQAYLTGQTEVGPVIEQANIQAYSDELIIVFPAMHGELIKQLENGKSSAASQTMQFWRECFPDRVYLEISRLGRPDEEQKIQEVVSFSEKEALPLVVSNQVRFLDRDDFEAHEARVCVVQGYVLADERRPKQFVDQQYFRNNKEMHQLFSDLPEALENTVQIAKRCNMAFKLDEVFLPEFPVPDGQTIDSFLREKTYEGLSHRLADLAKDDEGEKREEKLYHERLDFELNVIAQMGFPGYFLIVADFIEWAKEHAIPVGPGRGSGAGSLVAYCLGITELDPLEFDLLFERFLNPERVSMPDFDIDFCMDKRDLVIEYVADKYGRDNVSQIITYGTMAAKAVIRDVGRVLNHPYGFVDKLAKLIPNELGITLTDALEQEEVLKARYKMEDEVRVIIDLALKLEGITRNAGKHAGGVVIAPSPLTDFVALYSDADAQSPVSQFDKDDIERIGLVKFDFLGLRTLTIIDWALKNIQNRTGKSIDINLIPKDDVKTYELLKSCQTTAVFQLESRGMKDLIRRLLPDCFEEIVALVALFRPGPLQSGMVDDFINRKHGRAEVEYLHPELEAMLSTTYGVILYQEQVMQIAQVLAGYTLGEADLLRRAMGKKKPEEMAKQRKIFMAGAAKNNIDAKLAREIFDLMEKFAGYGFNKSHSAAYALIAYQTAWLKAHYPAEFMAAVLSSDMDNTDKVVAMLRECEAMELKVLPPNINDSDYQFTVNDSGEIVYGLGAIKGVGQSAIDGVIVERASGPFKDFFSFCRRIDLRKANRRVLEALIASGTLDCLGQERSVLSLSLERAMKAAEQSSKNASFGMQDMFADDTDTESQSLMQDYVNAPAWSEQTRLQGEKQTLGTYLSGHPLNRYQSELTALTTAQLAEVDLSKYKTITVAGLLVSVRTMMTKRNDRMAFIVLEDQSGQFEVTIFPKLYVEVSESLVTDSLLIMACEVSEDDYSGGHRCNATSVMTLNEARSEYASSLLLTIRASDAVKAAMQKLQQILSGFRTGTNRGMKVMVNYHRDGKLSQLQLGNEWRVHPSDELLEQLYGLLDEENVQFDYVT